MQIRITAPNKLNSAISLPASKSISNRALIIQALAQGETMPQHISDCDDTNVMVKALTHPTETIDIMAAGTAMRFLTAFLSVGEGTHVITGTERMKQRPIGILVNALREMGAEISYTEREGFPPLRITGKKYPGGYLCIPGNVSSQYISALLMIGPVLQQGLSLELTGEIVSRPYIDLTLKLMKDFGAQAQWTDEHHIIVHPTKYTPIPYYIESDWSAASYWYQIMALSTDEQAETILTGLFPDSAQGDATVQALFETLGVGTEFFQNETGTSCVRLHKQPRTIKHLEYDFINQPDLAQTFVVTCCMLDIPFHFKGLQSLKIKETDRITALIRELAKLGYLIQDAHDSELYWNGERTTPKKNPSIDTYEDHRMAMAFAPCSLVCSHIHINHPEVVSKSYPRYWDDLQSAGFEITPL